MFQNKQKLYDKKMKTVVSVTFIIMYNVYLYKPFNLLTVLMKKVKKKI